MESGGFIRKKKEDRPVLAICYDFDKTLSPDDMQAQGYIQEVGYDVPDFWKESNGLAEKNDMDQNLAYMYTMMDKAEGTLILKEDTLRNYGAKVELFPGVEEWFDRIETYADENNIIVEHYVISCGLKEMIEGTSIAKKGVFEKIYASSFYYNNKGVAKWPSQVVNYTNKTQFLFRIQKGVLDINDSGVNDFFEPENVRVPFSNIVYIGDSDTDVPCMKLVNSYGGHSIGVYNPKKKDTSKVYKMMNDNRIKYFAPADYNEGTDLDTLIKAIIENTASKEKLQNIHFECKKEKSDSEYANSEDVREKLDLINELERSGTFATTHTIVEKLEEIAEWTNVEKEKLFEIGNNNSQVYFILGDKDVSKFYTKLLKDMNDLSENAKSVKDNI